FEHKLSELPSSETAQAAGDAAPTILVDIAETQEIRTTENGIDKSQLAIATPRRRRSREHLRFVAQQACLVCGRKQSDPHHLRYLHRSARGRKVSAESAVPLSPPHPRAVHRAGEEQAWWKAAGIDPVKAARQLWRQTRLNNGQERHQAGIAARPETPSIASAPDGTSESRPNQVAIGRADDGRAP